MSASGLADPTTKASLGFTSGGGSSAVAVVDIRENVGQLYTFVDFPNWATITPFSVSYTPTVAGKIVVSVYGIGQSDNATYWYLTLSINEQLVEGGNGNGLLRAYATDTTGACANLSFMYPFSVDANATTLITLQGRTSNGGPDYPAYNLSWSVLFYPS